MMTAFLASTRVDIARPSGAVDVWGDDTGAVVPLPLGRDRDLPASVTEQSQRSYLGTEDRGGIVETFTVRLRPGTDVREGDRLTTTEGLILQVESVRTAPSLACAADVRCSARRVAPSSPT